MIAEGGWKSKYLSKAALSLSRWLASMASLVAAAAVKNLQYRWDLVGEAHVPIQVTLDVDQINEDEVIQKTAGHVKASEEAKELTCDTGAIFEEIEALYGSELQRQIDGKDINGAHVTYHKMGGTCTMMIGGHPSPSR